MSLYLNKLGDTSARAMAEYLPTARVCVSDLRPGDLVWEEPNNLFLLAALTKDDDGSYTYVDPLGNGTTKVSGTREMTIVARHVLSGTGEQRVQHAMREAWMPWKEGPLDDRARGFLDGLTYLIAKGCAIKAAYDVLLAWPPYDDDAESEEAPPRWTTPEDITWLARCGWKWSRDDSGGYCFSSFYPGG